MTKYIKESEDMKNTGDGMRAIRRHGGTVLVIYGVQRKDFKKIRILLAAEGIFVPDMAHLKRCGFFTVHHYHQDDWKSPSGRMSEEILYYRSQFRCLRCESVLQRDSASRFCTNIFLY